MKDYIPMDEAMKSMDRLTESYTSKMNSLAEECVHQKQNMFVYGFIAGVAMTSFVAIIIRFF
jgi:tetrahydromethanopterin S-methyltransferase subunit B